jgi:DNA-binding transcriptional LysR family regulator
METRRLAMFVTLVDAQSFGAAAEQLYITQPALSQQIIRLESDLGMQLLDRSTRPFSMTAAGREFYVRCQSVLENVRGLEDLMRQTNEGVLGRVRLGIVPSMLYGHLPPIIKAFRDAYPSVEVPIRYERTAQLLEEFTGGRVDVAVLLTAPRAKGLQTVTLYAEPYVVALTDDHPLAGQTAIAVSQLREERIITIPRRAAPENHDAIITACMQAGFSPHGLEAVGSYLDHIGLVSAGAGVTLVPQSLTQLHMPNVVFRELQDPRVDAVVSLCWYPDRVDAGAQRLIQHLRAAYAATPPDDQPSPSAIAHTSPGGTS